MVDRTKEFLFDKRLIERNLRQGLISKKDVEEHLAGAQDMADEAESIDVEGMLAEMRGIETKETPAE